MNTEHYIPLASDLLNQKTVNKLLIEKKAKGFGIYIAILMELRRQEDYMGDSNLLRTLSKVIGINIKILENIVRDYDLFEITETDEGMKFTSPYLNEVMQKLDKTHKRRSENGKKGAAKRWQKNMTVVDGQAIAIYSNSSNNTCSSEQKDNRKLWEKYIDQAIKDSYWLELLAMRSGWGETFHARREEIIDAFKEHVLLQGTENNINSLSEAKAYLANFLRPGTPTHKNIYLFLKRTEAERTEKYPYRFESIDQQTGKRSYYGQDIPDDAPPRPDANSIWDSGLRQWIR